MSSLIVREGGSFLVSGNGTVSVNEQLGVVGGGSGAVLSEPSFFFGFSFFEFFVFVVVFVVFLFLLFLFWYRRRNRKQNENF